MGRKILYYIGRGTQLLGMWLLIVNLFTAGPLGPSFQLFAGGIIAFFVGWLLTRAAGLS